MSVLTKNDILERISNSSITFKPGLDVFQLQAHSVDLRLGFTFLIPKTWRLTLAGREPIHLDYYSENKRDLFDIVELEKGQYFDLMPHEHVLVSSLESVTVPNDLMAVMYPRSSTNRKGISVDLTGIIDSGYEGQLVIPIRNNTQAQTVRLYPGERFCQLVFQTLASEVVARKSRYHQKDIIEGVDVDSKLEEKEIEIALLKSGDISKLKTEHGIETTQKPGISN